MIVSAIFKSYGFENGGFFKSVSRVCKKEAQRFRRAFFYGAADETKSEPEVPASVTCSSMDFTRWSSENSQYTCQLHIMGEYNKLEFI